MTEGALKNYTRAIAYQAVKFQRGQIDGKELVRVLRASLGEDVFNEAIELLEKDDMASILKS